MPVLDCFCIRFGDSSRVSLSQASQHSVRSHSHGLTQLSHVSLSLSVLTQTCVLCEMYSTCAVVVRTDAGRSTPLPRRAEPALMGSLRRICALVITRMAPTTESFEMQPKCKTMIQVAHARSTGPSKFEARGTSRPTLARNSLSPDVRPTRRTR